MKSNTPFSILIKDVAGVDAGEDVGEVGGCAVGEDGVALGLEGGEVVDDAAAEEG